MSSEIFVCNSEFSRKGGPRKDKVLPWMPRPRPPFASLSTHLEAACHTPSPMGRELHLLKGLSFPRGVFLHHLPKPADFLWGGLFLGSPFCCIVLCDYFCASTMLFYFCSFVV